MHRRRRGLVLIAPAIALVMALGACSSAGGNGQGGDTAEAPGVQAVTINKTPRSEIKDGGTLRWPIEQFSTQWNYNHLNGPEVSTADVMYAMMPSPYRVTAEGVPELNPNYVTDVRVRRDPQQVVTYVLNPKAEWYDGTPITWKTYRAQWQALNGENKAYQVASTTGYDQIASVEKGEDKFHVVVTFEKPYADFESLFSPLYPVTTNSDPQVFNEGWLSEIRTTAGPFKLSKIDKAAKTITLVRNEKWWGPRAKLDKIVFVNMSPDAMQGAFANGAIDFFDVGADSGAYKRAKQVPNTDIRVAGAPNFRHFTLNGRSPVLSDVKVRRAVALSINRKALVQSDLKGLPWPDKVLNNHLYLPNQKGYRDNTGRIGKYDPKQARKLLDEAGWTGQNGIRTKDGKKLELTFLIPTGVSTSENEAKLTQTMLKEIGIKVDIKAVPTNTFFDKYVSPGNFDIVPFSWIGTAFPSSSSSIYAKPTQGENGLKIQQNFARIGSEEIDRLFNKAGQTLNPEKSRKLYNRIDKLIWDEVHSLSLYQRPEIIACNADLANFGAFGFFSGSTSGGTPIYENVGFVK
ncbi:peptide/nickel transport system substrate-binding protein [Halopolyspora algeriensis]|uniref:Peptide/nickel transport system substrate-binding protein n=1 Tax=Halopolyspora algeriensis TaxID=1500506 RepID=A0A368VGF2_9ACTN|nr:ABC transporter family substrate-binding protein [Halopolyspora algeriensis]RCW40360.1 peptide/nickel transport system substrate-binding protein [Halopolyspora algeriensis]TQM53644.1 peptide/nickel transport system substrate-binding protein [Halopolyspora algeriensis]